MHLFVYSILLEIFMHRLLFVLHNHSIAHHVLSLYSKITWEAKPTYLPTPLNHVTSIHTISHRQIITAQLALTKSRDDCSRKSIPLRAEQNYALNFRELHRC